MTTTDPSLENPWSADAANGNTTPPPFPDFLKDGPFIPTSAHFPVKFDGDNYPLWHRQVFGLFRGLRLHGLLDGSILLQPKSTDPVMLRWCDQDALLQQALITSLHPSILSCIATADTCREIWVTLHSIYANASPSRVLNLNERLQYARKEPDQSVSAFLLHLHSLRTELAKLGHPVSDATFKLYLVNAIQGEFPEIASYLRMTTERFSFEAVHANLVSCEESRRRQSLLQQPVTANAAVKFPQQIWSNPAPQGISTPHLQQWFSAPLPAAIPSISDNSSGTSQPSFSFYSGPVSGPQTSLLGPGPSSQFNNQNRPNNQNRSNQNKSNKGKRTNNQNRTFKPADQSESLVCQICKKPNHTADRCYWRYQPQAQVAQTGSQEILLDSGASHHVTNDFSRLNLVSDYSGTDSLHIGNGQGLRITHVGNFSLSSLPHLSLPHTLYVSHIKSI